MKSSNFKKLTLAAVIATMLSGCATHFSNVDEAKGITSDRTQSAMDEFERTTKPKMPEVKEAPRDMATEFQKAAPQRLKGDVNVQARQTPFAPILSEIASTAGYSVAFGDMVDVNRPVTISFQDATAEEAIRTSAFLAGYAAVFDKSAKTIYIADTASYMFRLPSSVFKALQAQYAVGGNPSNTSGSSSSGGSGGGTSLKAEFNVTGTTVSSTADGLSKFLKDLAGKNSEVFVNDTGMVNVRGNAQALRRVHEFLKTFSRSAMTQVEIEASVVEVALKNEFAMGIKWQNVMNKATIGISHGVTSAANEAMKGGMAGLQGFAADSGGTSLFRTTANSSTLINALAEYTDVKVVSQPRMLSMNNVPATFFDGTQLPYLGKMDKTTGSNNQGDTYSGSVAFAIDGISFSAFPSVVTDESVQISLVPVLSSVTGFEKFLDGQMTAPLQTNKQTFMQVLAENGKTLVLGGIRYTSENKTTSVAQSTGKTTATKEIVILLRANVIPAPAFDPIVSEML